MAVSFNCDDVEGIVVPSRVSTAPNAFRLTSVVVASGDMNSLYARAAQGEFAYCKCDQECKTLASVS